MLFYYMNKKIILKKIPEAINQIDFVHKLYFDIDFENKKKIEKSLHYKINGYKSQDKRKKRKCLLITIEELIEKILISKLNCYYCKQKMLLLYTMKRDPRQWTLDRINNNEGHSKENTVIACLQCNLNRRTLDDKKFLFTKQMKLIKKK